MCKKAPGRTLNPTGTRRMCAKRHQDGHVDEVLRAVDEGDDDKQRLGIDIKCLYVCLMCLL